MKTNDYVKFLTETLVEYLDQPKEERKRKKIERKKQERLYKWFGIMPYAMKEEFQMMRRKIRKKG